MIIGTIISFFLGLAVSWLFWKYLNNMKPEIDISEFVAAYKTSQGKQILAFKIINKGKREVIDINVEATISKLVKRDGETFNTEISRLKFKFMSIHALGVNKKQYDPWEVAPMVIFISYPSVKDMDCLKDNEFRILFWLRCVDPSSNTTIAIRKRFSKENIKIGRFHPRMKLKVIPKK